MQVSLTLSDVLTPHAESYFIDLLGRRREPEIESLLFAKVIDKLNFS